MELLRLEKNRVQPFTTKPQKDSAFVQTPLKTTSLEDQGGKGEGVSGE